MGWIGITDRDATWFDPQRAESTSAVPDDGLMMRGTIMVETRLSAEVRPQMLFAFARNEPVNGRFSLQALPNGGIVLVDAQGDNIRHATLPFTSDGRLDILRISYCWDASCGWAQLTLERPETEAIQSVIVEAPLPVSLNDLNAALVHKVQREIGDDVNFVAISSRIEPVGPMPGLTGRVQVMTRDGEKPASDIRRGDVVITREGASVPVLQVVSRTVPALGSFRPIRLRAPYFGLTRDIVVAPQKRLVMSGSQVEYMFGREAVLVPARHLVNDRSAFVAKGPDLVTYHDLLLPGHEEVLASGCPLESLYVGRLRRKPDALSNSVLAGFDRARLPEHAKPVWQVLKPFEAVTLAMVRAA